MLTFSSKEKAYFKRLGGKVRGIKISPLPSESPSHSPPILCLGSHLLPISPCSITFFCSYPLCLFHHPALLLSPPFRLCLTLLVQGTTNTGAYRCAAVPLCRRIAVPPSRLAAVPLCRRPDMLPTRYVCIDQVTTIKYSGIFYTTFKLKALIGKTNLTHKL